MNRAELEHIIRAASGITNQADIVVIGSQSILAQFPNAPSDLLASMEADVFPLHRPDLSLQVDGAIGERSIFHETFGYYAHGVDETTATLPSGWKDRLVVIRNPNTSGAAGWCLEVHDLAASKLMAGREKDLEFVGILLSGRGHKYADARGQGFLAQARRERRAYPSGVCKERATPPEPKGPAALRVAPHWACGFVARWSQVHEGHAPSSRLATGPMRQQRTSSYLWP